MTYGRNGANAYAKTQVTTTTNQQELIVMAYDGILRFLKIAKEHMVKEEFEQKHVFLCKARAVIEELSATLNREKGGQIADNLWNLYMFFLKKITEANFSNQPEHLDDILPSIQDLRDGWAEMEIPEEDHAAQALNKTAASRESSHLTFSG
jgi:flagellar protein FliS